MPFHHSRLIATALAAGLFAMPAVAPAQTQGTQTPPAAQSQEQQPEQQPEQQQPQGEAAAPTDEQLASFAAATIDIVQIQKTAQQQMQAAVEKAGLTIDQYNGIAQAARTNPEIDQSLQQLIRDRLGG